MIPFMLRKRALLTCGMLALMLFLNGCEDDTDFEDPSELAGITFALTPEVGLPRPYIVGGETDEWRWETILEFTETNGGFADLHTGRVQIFIDDPDNPGSEIVALDQTLSTDDLIGLYGTLRLEPYSKLYAAYQIVNPELTNFRVQFTFEFDTNITDPALNLSGPLVADFTGNF